jgi:Flp pilus assembly pilin Flp
MTKLYTKTRTLLASLREESGQDLIEYCIVAAVVVAAAVAASPSLAGAITAAVGKLTAAIALA